MSGRSESGERWAHADAVLVEGQLTEGEVKVNTDDSALRVERLTVLPAFSPVPDAAFVRKAPALTVTT